jgi:hypothetical protein
MQILQPLLSLLLSPAFLATLGPVVAGVIGMIVRKLFKDQAARKQELLRAGVEIAYACVTEVAKRTQNKVDDKVAMALGYLKDWLNANGEQLKPVDETKAKLLFQAMHASELRDLGR